MSDIQLDFNQLKLTVMMLQSEMESLSDDVWRENQFVGNDDGDSFPWSSVHLSTRMTDTATATIQGGSFWVGTNAAVTLATSTRTILHDLEYLWLEYDYGANTLILSSPATSLPTLTASSDLFVLPLAKFSFDKTTAAITDYLYLGGDYHLPGTWAR